MTILFIFKLLVVLSWVSFVFMATVINRHYRRPKGEKLPLDKWLMVSTIILLTAAFVFALFA